jgi:Mg-chelatase subunit ChlD
MKRLYIALILLPIAVFSPLFGDERTGPIDVIIALDKSLSMVEEIDAVKEYVNTYVIDDLLIPGDFFLVVAFYGQTIVPVSMTIGGQADKERAKGVIGGLLADGRFTDIGNALDVLGEQVERHSRPDREKYLLLITDGIQEAPPQSKYYSPDGSFNHAFLENTKTIQKKGWKVVILGVGTHEQAQELAQDLAADYAQLSDEPTAEELIEKTQEFLAALKADTEVELGPIDLRGRGTLRMTVASQGYEGAKTVTIRAILLSLPGAGAQNILPEPVAWEVPPEAAARYSAAVIGALVLIALIVLIILLATRARKAKFRFRLVVEGQAPDQAQDVYKVVQGKPQYLEEQEGFLGIKPSRSAQSLARLTAIPKGLRMDLLKPEHFPKLTELPVSLLDFDFRVRIDLDKRRDVTVRLASIG